MSKDRDVADQAGGDSDEVRARKAIAGRRSLSRDGSKKRRVEHKSLRTRPDNVLDAATSRFGSFFLWSYRETMSSSIAGVAGSEAVTLTSTRLPDGSRTGSASQYLRGQSGLG